MFRENSTEIREMNVKIVDAITIRLQLSMVCIFIDQINDVKMFKTLQ